MKVLTYFRSLNVCTTGELLELKRLHPVDYDVLMIWTREQMLHNGIDILEA